MLLDIFVGLTGMQLVSLPLGPWLVVPLSFLLLLVVGCSIILLPCAFGMVALNLARLIIVHGGVLVALVTYPDLQIVTLMLCMVGWLVHVQEILSLVPCSSLTCACLYLGPSYLPVNWSCPLALPLGLLCLCGLSLWVWLGWFVSLPPWFPFCGVGWFFTGLFAPSVWSGRLCLPSPWVLCPCWAFALGVHRVLSLGWLLLLLLLWLRPRSALSMWGQFRSEFTQSLGDQGVFCNTAIENAKADKALRAAVDSLDNNRDTTEEF